MFSKKFRTCFSLFSKKKTNISSLRNEEKGDVSTRSSEKLNSFFFFMKGLKFFSSKEEAGPFLKGKGMTFSRFQKEKYNGFVFFKK